KLSPVPGPVEFIYIGIVRTFKHANHRWVHLVHLSHSLQTDFHRLSPLFISRRESITLQFHAIFKQWHATSFRIITGKRSEHVHKPATSSVIPRGSILRTSNIRPNTTITPPQL